MLGRYLTTILDKVQHVTVNRSQEYSTGTLLNSECTGGDKLYSGEEIWCSKFPTGEGKLVLYCSQEKGIGALLISGEGNWCYTFFYREAGTVYPARELCSLQGVKMQLGEIKMSIKVNDTHAFSM